MIKEVDSFILERRPTQLIKKYLNESFVPNPMHSAVKLSESYQEAEVYNLIWKGKAYTCGTAKAHTSWCWDTVKGVPHQREISAGPWKKKKVLKR